MTAPDRAMPSRHLAPMPPAYTAPWELFVDWCTVTGHPAVPATSSTVLAFLQDCPAAPATQALRVRAITTAHTRTDQPPPARTPAILDILRGRPRRPDPRIPLPPGHVDQLLAALPIHGWTAGWFGRRDRALLALADTGLPYRTLARLRLDDVHLTPAAATITVAGDAFVTVSPHPDPTRCRPCALALWGNALRLAVTGATARVARAVDTATPLTTDSPHRCHQPLRSTAGSTPLLPTSTPWGHLDVQPAALSPRTLSRLARTDQHRPHRHHPPTPVPESAPPAPGPPAPPRLDPLDTTAAAARRHAAAAALAPLAAVLDDLDTAAAELERRTAALLASLTGQ